MAATTDVTNPDEPTTTCVCCGERIWWAVVSQSEETYMTWDGTTGCPDPLQPNEGPFPHEPAEELPAVEEYRARLQAEYLAGA